MAISSLTIFLQKERHANELSNMFFSCFNDKKYKSNNTLVHIIMIHDLFGLNYEFGINIITNVEKVVYMIHLQKHVLNFR